MQEKDFEWFIENYDSILENYGQCFVVVKNKTILGSFKKYSDGVKAALKEHEIGTFI